MMFEIPYALFEDFCKRKFDVQFFIGKHFLPGKNVVVVGRIIDVNGQEINTFPKCNLR